MGAQVGECQLRQSYAVPTECAADCVKSPFGSNCLGEWLCPRGTRLTVGIANSGSVAHVVRPRTNSTNACLCFTFMSKLPEHKPWKRAAGEKDPSRSIILDLHTVLQEECDWKMPATMMMHTNEIQLSTDDNTQIQCLPVYRTDRPKWAYRKVPKVTRFRNFDRLPSWSRRLSLCRISLMKKETIY